MIVAWTFFCLLMLAYLSLLIAGGVLVYARKMKKQRDYFAEASRVFHAEWEDAEDRLGLEIGLWSGEITIEKD